MLNVTANKNKNKLGYMQYIIPHMDHDVFCISITTNKIINTWEGAISRILSYHLMRLT